MTDATLGVAATMKVRRPAVSPTTPVSERGIPWN